MQVKPVGPSHFGSRLLLVHFRRFSGTFETSLRIMAKAMRAAKAMKAMKRVSKFAKGKLAKLVVFRGNKEATLSGLTKSSLMKNKHGRIVSKKQSANGKKAYARIKGWTLAADEVQLDEEQAREDREQEAER